MPISIPQSSPPTPGLSSERDSGKGHPWTSCRQCGRCVTSVLKFLYIAFFLETTTWFKIFHRFPRPYKIKFGKVLDPLAPPHPCLWGLPVFSGTCSSFSVQRCPPCFRPLNSTRGLNLGEMFLLSSPLPFWGKTSPTFLPVSFLIDL